MKPINSNLRFLSGIKKKGRLSTSSKMLTKEETSLLKITTNLFNKQSLCQTIISTNKKFSKQVHALSRNANTSSLNPKDIEWVYKRALYYQTMVKDPPEMESLVTLVQNIAVVLTQCKAYGKAASLITKILKFLSFVSDKSKSLIFYTYSDILIKQMRFIEAKNYCKECLKLIERPVHRQLKIFKISKNRVQNASKSVEKSESSVFFDRSIKSNSKLGNSLKNRSQKFKVQGSFTRTFSAKNMLKKPMKMDSEEKTLFLNKLKLVLACYYQLLEIKIKLRERSIAVTDLPDDLKIAQKGIRLAKNYLHSDSNLGIKAIREHYISIFQEKIDTGFCNTAKEKYTLKTFKTDSTAEKRLFGKKRRFQNKLEKYRNRDRSVKKEQLDRLERELRGIGMNPLDGIDERSSSF